MLFRPKQSPNKQKIAHRTGARRKCRREVTLLAMT
jgi:hypothetical protein